MFEPVPGSLMAVKQRRCEASSGWRKRSFCSGVPSAAILWIEPFVMLSMVRSDSQAEAGSSISMAQGGVAGLLHQHGPGERVQVHAAFGLRHPAADVAELRQFLEELERKALVGVMPGDQRRDLAFHEASDVHAQQRLLGVGSEIHRAASWECMR